MAISEDERVAKAFEKTLNRHGYGFHYAVVQRAAELFKKEQSPWIFKVAEYPTEAQGRGTRVDFVLKRKNNLPFVHGADFPFYLISECKRANPATSNWCFIEAPFTHRNPSDRLYLEQAQLDESNRMTSSAEVKYTSESTYHIGLEVKTDKKGNPAGSTRGEIERAATQVLRGLNGMINYLATNLGLFQGQKRLYLLPVIFTTAKLWVTDADLSNADLESGNVDPRSVGSRNVDWLIYQYNTSPGLKHSFSPEERGHTLTHAMQSEYIRTVPIVSPAGIEAFLKWSGDLDFE